jgi:hypothetical protein
MRLIPAVELSRVQHKIVSTLTGFALALTVVHFSAARSNEPTRTR